MDIGAFERATLAGIYRLSESKNKYSSIENIVVVVVVVVEVVVVVVVVVVIRKVVVAAVALVAVILLVVEAMVRAATNVAIERFTLYFENQHTLGGSVAEWLARRTRDLEVVGSIPDLAMLQLPYESNLP
ncbi:hypothetical protein ElyMa_005486900 [Elysia marginata]|uniref:Uncharacterized protein n=1 Tax=Elysia marginata TaxID=1093978 RepID=A0AAV4ER45_9GAST|nr:hypothetical protein ElyMa_005486900 [Elysia marginata]